MLVYIFSSVLFALQALLINIKFISYYKLRLLSYIYL